MEEEEGGSREGGVGTDGRDGGWCRGGDPGRAAGSGALMFFLFFFFVHFLAEYIQGYSVKLSYLNAEGSNIRFGFFPLYCTYILTYLGHNLRKRSLSLFPVPASPRPSFNPFSIQNTI